MGMPTKEEELKILECYMEKEPLQELVSVIELEKLQQIKEEIKKVFVHKAVQEYMVDIITATRNAEGIVMGVSPRGSLALLRCVKAYAFLEGRKFVIPDDVKAVAIPVLAHRIIMGYGKEGKRESKELIEFLLNNTKVPTEDFEV